MRQLVIIALFSTWSFSAFAQFPLGADKENIASYFAVNVPYASVQEFKTQNGEKALCFTKVRVVGDYTFYFNQQGVCTWYTVTYDAKQVNDIIWRFDRKFCRISPTEWTDENGKDFKITLVLHPQQGANFVSVVYKPIEKPGMGAKLASN